MARGLTACRELMFRLSRKRKPACCLLADTQCPLPSITDRALYIYTSGTTGLPKAANVSHYRVMQWSHWFAGLLDTRVTDRMRITASGSRMYQQCVGGVVAVGATLVNGGSVSSAAGDFSARRFWEDIVTAKECTLFQYIGELCRFLIACCAAVAAR